jgi:transforming growth factor-beta-induced protein
MKNIMKRSMVIAAGLVVGTAAWTQTLAAGTNPEESSHRHPGRNNQNVVERLERLGDFSILLTALETANLDEALQADGPFTLFAPTDRAFGELLEQLHITAPELLANPDLASILLYHVVPGKLRAGELLKSSAQTTLSDAKSLLVVVEGRDVLVNRAKVTRANVPAENGVIHVIDKVLLPPAETAVVNNLADVLALDGRFSILLTALRVTGLDDAVSGDGPFTVFAPTDEAFADLLGQLNVTPEQLLADPNLSNILLYHVLGSRKGAIQLLISRDVPTLQGGELTIRPQSGGIYVNESRVINPNINAPNGVIHTIDTVLIP